MAARHGGARRSRAPIALLCGLLLSAVCQANIGDNRTQKGAAVEAPLDDEIEDEDAAPGELLAALLPTERWKRERQLAVLCELRCVAGCRASNRGSDRVSGSLTERGWLRELSKS